MKILWILISQNSLCEFSDECPYGVERGDTTDLVSVRSDVVAHDLVPALICKGKISNKEKESPQVIQDMI